MRFADPDATIMIHDVSSGGRGKIEELKADVAEADRLDEKIFTMMARNCGKKDDYFKKKVFNKKHADWFMDAAEAKAPRTSKPTQATQMKIKVDVDIDFRMIEFVSIVLTLMSSVIPCRSTLTMSREKLGKE